MLSFIKAVSLSVWLVACLVLPQAAFCFPSSLNLFSAEPEPFRREDIYGRDYRYSDTAFLDRFSYRLSSDWQRYWDAEREGFVITAGSINTRQLYSVGSLRKKIPFDEKYFGVLRYQVEEDFDSRYQRFLTGVGVSLSEKWSLALVGNIVSIKADIDPQLELAWDGEGGDRFRFVFVSGDHFYNQKNSDGFKYKSRPVTFFIEGGCQLNERLFVSGWLNWNPQFTLDMAEEGDFKYRQIAFNASTAWKMAGQWQFVVALGGENGLRQLNTEEPSLGKQKLDRDHAALTLESQYRYSPTFSSFHGVHYFYLSEEGEYQEVIPPGGDRRRSELMPYGGVHFNLSDKIAVTPAIYLDYIDNKEVYGDEDQWRNSRRLLGKVSLPVEYRFSEQVVAAFSASMKLHEASFGGFNAQFLVRF